jgi:polysaccharide biosynthesis transport protein
MAEVSDSQVNLCAVPADSRASAIYSRPDLLRGANAAPATLGSTNMLAKKVLVGPLSARRVLVGIRHYWILAVLLAFVSAILAFHVVSTLLGAPTFTVRTQLHVAQNKPVILYDTPDGRTDFSTYQRGQVAMLKSRRVLQSAINRLADKNLPLLENNPDALAWLETAVQADFALAPEHLRITLKGSKPDELILVLDAVRESYLSICVNAEQARRKERMTDLTGLLDGSTKLRDQRLEEISALAEKEASTRDPNMVKATRDDVYLTTQQLHSHLRGVQATIDQTKVLSAAPTAPEVRLPLKPTADEPTLERLQEAFDRDPALTSESAKLTVLDDYLRDRRLTLVRYQQDDGYREKLAERAELETRVEERKQAITRNLRSAGRPTDSIAMPIGTAVGTSGEDLIKKMEGYAGQLKEQIREHEERTERLTRAHLKIEAIRVQATREDARVAEIARQIDTLEAEQKAPDRTTLLEEAVISQVPSPDKQFKMALGAAGGGGVAAFVLVGVLAALRYRVESLTDVAGIAPVLGILPRVGQVAREALTPPVSENDLNQFHLMCDAVDVIRCLALPKSGPHGYVLLVTSGMAGDGKSTVSGLLAGRLARCGYRTLLVDANVRHPGAAAYLPTERTIGYGDVVCGLADLESAVQPGPVDGLDLLTAGQSDVYTTNAYLDSRLPELLNELRRRYDVVVVDGPPVLSAPEAVVIARWVNGVLFAARRHVSRVNDLREAVARVTAVSASVCGIVLSEMEPTAQTH